MPHYTQAFDNADVGTLAVVHLSAYHLTGDAEGFLVSIRHIRTTVAVSIDPKQCGIQAACKIANARGDRKAAFVRPGMLDSLLCGFFREKCEKSKHGPFAHTYFKGAGFRKLATLVAELENMMMIWLR